jgi:TonB family protein
MPRHRHRAALALGLALLTLANAAPAAAQADAPAAAAPAPTLTPPRVAHFVEAPRPEGAGSEGASVELELTIAADGALLDAKVVGPAGEGWDAAALAAVKQFTFEPARRGDKGVPARIRYRYTFDPLPPPEPVPAEVDAGTATADAGTAPEGGPATPADTPLPSFGATASIAAPPRETTKRELSTAELTRTAGTRGDALRVVELLPGVARSPGLNGFLVIRGAGPQDSQVIFEGGPVERLYHFGGLTSFVQPRLLEKIDLYPGNFSARYGRKVGGIVDVGVRDPRRDGYHGIADVNMIDASILAEGPVGERGAFAVAAKRSYVDFWFKNVVPQDALGVTAAPVYYDYQAIYSYKTESGSKLRLMWFGSDDVFSLNIKAPADGDPAVHGNFSQASSFHRLQATWKQALGAGVDQEITAGAGTMGFHNAIGAYALDVDAYDAFVRAEWRVRLGQAAKLIGGFDGYVLSGDVKYFGPIILQQDGNPRYYSGPLSALPMATFDGWWTTVRPAGYVEAVVNAGDRVQLVPGLRADYFTEGGSWSIHPRFSGRWRVAGQTTLKGGAGLYSQPPQLGEAIEKFGNPNLGLTKAQHYSVGVEQRFGAVGSITLDTFYKRLWDVQVAGVDASGRETQVNGGKGRIYGLETMAKLNPTGRAFGFISYTFSRSERQDHPGEAWRLFDFDQTHILSVAGGYRLPRNWDLGATFRLVSGNPTTPVKGSVYDAASDYYTPLFGAVNSARNPLFHQLSVRVEKAWRFNAWALAAYLDVQNAYNHRSQEGLQYSYDYKRSAPIEGLPVLPSLGLRGEL